MIDADVQRSLGKLEGKLDAFIAELANGNNSRARMHEKIDRIGSDVRDVKHQVDALTSRVAALEPDVQDYRAKRHQVDGAGKLGKVLWWLGGVILTAASGLVGWLIWAGLIKPPH